MHIFMGVLAPHDRAFSPISPAGNDNITVTDELGRPRVGGSLHSVSVGSLTKQHELM